MCPELSCLQWDPIWSERSAQVGLPERLEPRTVSSPAAAVVCAGQGREDFFLLCPHSAPHHVGQDLAQSLKLHTKAGRGIKFSAVAASVKPIGFMPVKNFA